MQPQLGKIRICKVIYMFLGKITTYIRQLCNCKVIYMFLGKITTYIRQLCNCKVAKLLNCLIILVLCKCDFATLQVCKVTKVIVNQCVILNFANFANFASAFFLQSYDFLFCYNTKNQKFIFRNETEKFSLFCYMNIFI